MSNNYMNNNFYKYLKYKKKYIDLKYLEGGGKGKRGGISKADKIKKEREEIKLNIKRIRGEINLSLEDFDSADYDSLNLNINDNQEIAVNSNIIDLEQEYQFVNGDKLISRLYIDINLEHKGQDEINNDYYDVYKGNFSIYSLEKDNDNALGKLTGNITEINNKLFITILDFNSGTLIRKGGNAMLCIFLAYLYHLGYTNIDLQIDGAVGKVYKAYMKQGFEIIKYDISKLQMPLEKLDYDDGEFYKICKMINISEKITDDFVVIPNIKNLSKFKKIDNITI